MVVRHCAIRPVAGFSTLAKTTLTSLALMGGLAASTSPAFAAPTGWGSSAPRSVLVQSNGRRPAMPFASQSSGGEIPQGVPVEEVAPGHVATDSFDGDFQSEGVIVGSPQEMPTDAGSSGGYGEPNSYGSAAEGVYAGPVNGGYVNGGYEGGYDGQEPGQLACGVPGCQGGCHACQQGSCGLPEWRYNAECEPMGLLQKMYLLHRGLKSEGCWTGRVDALILSRNAPGFRPLYTFNPATAGNALNADQLESIAAVGPRMSLFHKDRCGNTSWESTYIYSGGFVAQQALAPTNGGYLTAEPGIYGNDSPPINNLDTASARLTSALQSAELNRRWCWGSCTQFLAGFRWLQWQENLNVADVYGSGSANAGQDVYNNGCYNNLFGGQIGLDTALWQPSKHFRLEGLVKAGAYYNSAYQSSSYQNYVGGVAGDGSSISVGNSPATCSFAGELGLTGVVPVCCNVDFRFGYFGLWLTSIAQPANQLSGQVLAPGQPTYGSLATNGNVVLQGLSLGLEGRW